MPASLVTLIHSALPRHLREEGITTTTPSAPLLLFGLVHPIQYNIYLPPSISSLRCKFETAIPPFVVQAAIRNPLPPTTRSALSMAVKWFGFQ